MTYFCKNSHEAIGIIIDRKKPSTRIRVEVLEHYFLRFVLMRLWYKEENAAKSIPVIGKMLQAVPQAL